MTSAVSDKVGGTNTVNLAEMPWEQALTIALAAMGLVKHEKDAGYPSEWLLAFVPQVTLCR